MRWLAFIMYSNTFHRLAMAFFAVFGMYNFTGLHIGNLWLLPGFGQLDSNTTWGVLMLTLGWLAVFFFISRSTWRELGRAGRIIAICMMAVGVCWLLFTGVVSYESPGFALLMILILQLMVFALFTFSLWVPQFRRHATGVGTTSIGDDEHHHPASS